MRVNNIAIVAALGAIVIVCGVLGLLLFNLPSASDEVRPAATRFLTEVRSGQREAYTTAAREFDPTSASSKPVLEWIRESSGVDFRNASIGSGRACMTADLLPGKTHFAMRLVREADQWKVAEIANRPEAIKTCENVDR